MSEDPNLQSALGAVRPDKDADVRGRRRKRKVSYLTLNDVSTVDYKDVPTLRRFLNDRGKIVPARQSGNTASQQRMISEAIRRAREMALLPFVVTEISAEKREYSPRRERFGARSTEGEAAAPAAEAATPEAASE